MVVQVTAKQSAMVVFQAMVKARSTMVAWVMVKQTVTATASVVVMAIWMLLSRVPATAQARLRATPGTSEGG